MLSCNSDGSVTNTHTHITTTLHSSFATHKIWLHSNTLLQDSTPKNTQCLLSDYFWGPGRVGPSIPYYPFNYFKISHIWQIPPKFSKHCIPISLKMIQVSPIPFTKISRIPLNIYKNILYPFKFWPISPVSLKTLPGPQFLQEYEHFYLQFKVKNIILRSKATKFK